MKVISHVRWVVFQIIDHGKGLTQEQKKRIFDRYYRVETSHTDKAHFGLGLNIAKELVQLQNGKISVEDTKMVAVPLF